MRWGRGIFRAWIVLTVIWIVVAIFIFEVKTLKSLIRPNRAFDVQLVAGTVHSFDTNQKRSRLRRNIERALLDEVKKLAAAGKTAAAENLQRNFRTTSEEIMAELDKRNQEAWDMAVRAGIFIAGPPLAILVLGSVITWVFVGLKRE